MNVSVRAHASAQWARIMKFPLLSLFVSRPHSRWWCTYSTSLPWIHCRFLLDISPFLPTVATVPYWRCCCSWRCCFCQDQLFKTIIYVKIIQLNLNKFCFAFTSSGSWTLVLLLEYVYKTVQSFKCECKWLLRGKSLDDNRNGLIVVSCHFV